MAESSGPVLVTGAAGFIGSHICEALARGGSGVVGVDNLDPFYDPALKERAIREVAATAQTSGSQFELCRADICDHAAMHAIFDRVRPATVIHLAAKAGVRPSIADPAGYARVNVLGTQVILECARAAGARRVVMASSSSVYGNNRVVPFSEEHAVEEPISPYAATKRACELIAHTHHHLTRMPTACLRFFTVYGPRQRPDLAISMFMRRIASRQSIELFGDGSTSRDYTYIDDIVRGVLAAVSRIDRFGYRVWNLGGSSPVTLSDMVATIVRTVGVEPVIERRPMQAGDVERTWADVRRSAQELGFVAQTKLEEGVARQWAWMKGGGV